MAREGKSVVYRSDVWFVMYPLGRFVSSVHVANIARQPLLITSDGVDVRYFTIVMVAITAIYCFLNFVRCFWRG